MAETVLLDGGMLRVTVDRAYWGTGRILAADHKNGYGSYLFNLRSGRLCCMGFACIAAGLPKERISGVTFPHYLGGLPAALSGLILGASGSDVAYDLARVNDDKDSITDAERELRIVELGKQANLLFEFVGEYPIPEPTEEQ